MFTDSNNYITEEKYTIFLTGEVVHENDSWNIT